VAETIRLRAADLEWRELDGEVVVLDVRSARYLSVNDTGAALWPLLERGTTAAALSAELQDHFGVAPAEAERDVEAFLSRLEELALVERAG
jgi:hypothetical protein